jgi:hypothetical protein
MSSHSALPRKVAASISDEGCSPCCRVSGRNNQFYHKNTDGVPLHHPHFRRARQMRLPTSYKPVLVHRPNSLPPRPRNLLPPTPARRPPSPDAEEAAAQADHALRPTRPIQTPPTNLLQPKPRTAASSFVSPSHQHHHHPDDNHGAHRESSPARTAVSQPGPSSTAFTVGAPGDSEARVSLWAELKDIRRRARTPGAITG